MAEMSLGALSLKRMAAVKSVWRITSALASNDVGDSSKATRNREEGVSAALFFGVASVAALYNLLILSQYRLHLILRI